MSIWFKSALVVGAIAGAAGVWIHLARTQPVSDAEARGFVDQLVQIVEVGDALGLCEHAVLQGSCEILIDEVGERVPTVAPEVVCTWPLSGSNHRVVALSGTDGMGDGYVNYLAVVRDGSRLRGSPTVYWVDHVIEDLDLAFEGDVVCR